MKTKEDVYRIKPLEWTRDEEEIETHDDLQNRYTAVTTFGPYIIELIGTKWYVRYSFREYYDDGNFATVSSLDVAKDVAEVHWKHRLGKALFPISEQNNYICPICKKQGMLPSIYGNFCTDCANTKRGFQ